MQAVQQNPPSAGVRPSYAPPPPKDPEALGVNWSLVLDIAVRRIYFDGTTNISALAAALHIAYPLADRIFRHFRKHGIVDILTPYGEDFTFTLTGKGHDLAANRLRLTQYAGPVPVSLQQYEEAVRAQAAHVDLDEKLLAESLSDLVVTGDLLDQLGPAVVSQKSLFLYGPTGSGKTSIAERLVRIYRDVIVVPYAVAIDGQIVQLYDPTVHQRVELDFNGLDPRWVPCQRPRVMVGGELSREMLDLRFEPAARIYAPPVQMKANNGILIIDDFGRQAIPPKELLNRWIVPLDRRIDHLALQHGAKFSIPFELMVVFATNLDPKDLADEAFLRRIPNKILIGPCPPEIFDEIFHRVVRELGLTAPAGAAELARTLCLEAGASELRACYPADLCSILVWIARYKHRPVEIDGANLRRAVKLYFTQEATTEGRS